MCVDQNAHIMGPVSAVFPSAIALYYISSLSSGEAMLNTDETTGSKALRLRIPVTDCNFTIVSNSDQSPANWKQNAKACDVRTNPKDRIVVTIKDFGRVENLRREFDIKMCVYSSLEKYVYGSNVEKLENVGQVLIQKSKFNNGAGSVTQNSVEFFYNSRRSVEFQLNKCLSAMPKNALVDITGYKLNKICFGKPAIYIDSSK